MDMQLDLDTGAGTDIEIDVDSGNRRDIDIKVVADTETIPYTYIGIYGDRYKYVEIHVCI